MHIFRILRMNFLLNTHNYWLYICSWLYDCTNTPTLNVHVYLIIIFKEKFMTANWYWWKMLNICRAFILVLNVNDVHFTRVIYHYLCMNLKHYILEKPYSTIKLTNNCGTYAIIIDIIMHIVQLSNLIQIWSDLKMHMPCHYIKNWA